MAAGYYDLVIDAGATFSETWTCYSDEAQTVLVNLTGATFKCQIRRINTNAAVLLDLTVSPCSITGGGAAGTIVPLIPSGTTATLPIGIWEWDIQVIIGGVSQYLMFGKARVRQRTSR
jgi:hypothetical protein